jgi:hypothetical protein
MFETFIIAFIPDGDSIKTYLKVTYKGKCPVRRQNSVKMCSSLNFDKCTTVRPRIINYISNERNLKILSRKVKNLAIQTKLIELDYSKDTSYIKMYART